MDHHEHRRLLIDLSTLLGLARKSFAGDYPGSEGLFSNLLVVRLSSCDV
jgi:hypothetical protein